MLPRDVSAHLLGGDAAEGAAHKKLSEAVYLEQHFLKTAFLANVTCIALVGVVSIQFRNIGWYVRETANAEGAKLLK